MVVFTCGHCGESVQKPKVEKHYMTKCRNRNPNLSCMDCFKDFLGNDYESHNKCITEEQRYSAKGFVAKEKKGEKKQNAWVEMVQSVLDEQKNASGNVLRILEIISKFNNTPRKKPKFVNFVKNHCNLRHESNLKDIDQAWDLLSNKLTDLFNVNNQNENRKQKDGSDEKGHRDVESKGEKQNGHTENGDAQQNAVVEDNKSRKQRKEEKKLKKYEAELQSAATPVEEDEEIQTKKKDKKKKNRANSTTNANVESAELDEKTKNKRKRQDTVNGNNEMVNVDQENKPVKEKAQKKKLKLEEQGISLHDQNVAQTEEAAMGKFDWHAVIISVLQKKDNEVPFKRLQKKVLAEYSEVTGREVDDRIADKFIKKLKSAPNVKVDKNRVHLVSE